MGKQSRGVTRNYNKRFTRNEDGDGGCTARDGSCAPVTRCRLSRKSSRKRDRQVWNSNPRARLLFPSRPTRAVLNTPYTGVRTTFDSNRTIYAPATLRRRRQTLYQDRISSRNIYFGYNFRIDKYIRQTLFTIVYRTTSAFQSALDIVVNSFI